VERHDFSYIEGYEQLRALFGEHLSFHDAEVVSIVLDRGDPGSNAWSPSLTATFHLFAFSHVAPGSKRPVYKSHTLAAIRFGAVSNLVLTEFNNQNALINLHVAPLESPEYEARYEVSFVQSFGVGASFRCHSIVLISLQPGIPEGSVYA
jgi:hypothetical protein